MSGRQITLEWCGLYRLERQRREQQRPTSERVAVRSDRSAACLADQRGQLADVGAVERNGDLSRIEPPVLLARRELSAAAPARSAPRSAGALTEARACAPPCVSSSSAREFMAIR